MYHLISGNIIDLTAQTLVKENWTHIDDENTVFSRAIHISCIYPSIYLYMH